MVCKMGIKQELGKKIKRIRQSRGLTQEQLAEAVDISPRTLSGIEVGENFLTAETLDKIVIALNTNYEELFALGHLKSTEELLKEIKNYIHILSSDNQKIETVYKFLKSLIID